MRFMGRAAWLVASMLAAATANAQEPTQKELAQEDRIVELERKVDVLVDELERRRTGEAVPEEPLRSVHGKGPAASKIYTLDQGLSMGGYAEGLFTAYVADKGPNDSNRIDNVRLVIYAGYKFTDSILFNAEVEFEHATTEATATSSGGSVSVEFAELDFLFRDEINARAGLLLVPMGFLNEIHEPPFYFGTHRPEVERRIIPSTWRENGVGVFGTLFGEQVEYRLYGINGLNAVGYESSGLREGRQAGSEALAEHWAFVGRMDWTPMPELLLGGSVYVGKAGQNQSLGGIPVPDSETTIYEVHGQYRNKGLHLRGLFTTAFVDDAGMLSLALNPAIGADLSSGEVVASQMIGGYAEVAYDVLAWLSPGSERSLEPFYRYEYIDTQQRVPFPFLADGMQQNQIHTVGLSFKPTPNVVLKADYRHRIAGVGSLADEVNLGIGLAF